ncbi:MAG: cytochrome c biogenesis protein CcsA [Coriobacteriia bacterium]
MVTAEVVLMWSAVTLYAVGAILYAAGFAFSRERVLSAALWVSLAGLAPHTAAVVVRWVRVGHGPYLGYYEVVSSFAWFSVVVLGLLVLKWRSLNLLGVLLMPVATLLIGSAMFTPKAAMEITPRLASWWLTLHVTFAKVSYAAFIASFVLAVAYLMRERGGGGRLAGVLEKLPRQEVLDDLSFRFVGFGFIVLGMMIGAGAIWANEAWGRYWGWDPIETWSLVSWLVYAAYLHTRLTLGWRGRKSAWFAALALPVVLFALIGVPIVYRSIHGAYLLGT